jgi:CBS-domain-containing membrane protein
LIVVNDDAQVLGVVSAADLLRAIPEIEDALERVRRERIHRPERPAT